MHVYASALWSFAPPWPFKGPPEGLRHSDLVARPRRVQDVPPKRLLDAAESNIFHLASSNQISSLSMNDARSYQSLGVSSEDKEMLDLVYGLKIDEEMGGMDLVNFKHAVSLKIEEEREMRSECVRVSFEQLLHARQNDQY